MAILPEQPEDSKTVQAIYAAYEKRPQDIRKYIGASNIGRACERAIWYEFRWAAKEQFSGRMLRLFETGHHEEPRIVADLKAIGCEVWDRDESTGEQFEYKGCNGHFAAHIDGVVLGIPEAPKTPHDLSIKTASAKSFKEIKTKGVGEAKPEYVAQVQIEMELSGLDRAIIIVKNKDTDELYSERIERNPAAGKALIEKASRIINSESAPERIADGPDKFPCVMCSHKGHCFGSQPPAPAVPIQVNCRTCCHVTPSPGGVWACAKKGDKSLSEQEQLAGCDDHLFNPAFLPFAKVVDSGVGDDGDWILYEKSDGREFANTRMEGGYRSIELTVIPEPLIGDPLVSELKGLGAECVDPMTVGASPWNPKGV